MPGGRNIPVPYHYHVSAILSQTFAFVENYAYSSILGGGTSISDGYAGVEAGGMIVAMQGVV